MKKKWLAPLILILTACALASCGQAAEAGDKKNENTADSLSFSGNLLKITKPEDFEAGSCTDLVLDPTIGDGALLLKEGATEGTFESAVYECAAFSQMCASWNAAIYEGTEVEVYARARYGGSWTEYLTWGRYTPFDTRGTKEGKTDEAAKVDQDTFCMADDKTADALQMKVVLRRASAETASPVLRMVSMSFKGGEMVPAYAEERLETIPERSLIAAPAYSQLVRAPKIARDICSPTSMTVMMNSRVPELDILPEELAINIRDEAEEIFGSWSFSASSAGLYGFNAYQQFIDLDIMLQELAKGHALCISVRYTPETDADYPHLDGVFDRVGGHLICLIGYEYEDGIRDEEHLYFYSSDSFSESDATCYRRYKWTQLKECSKNVAYIIPDSVQEVTGDLAPGILRKSAELIKDPDRTDTWILTADGQAVPMERFISGGGVLAVCIFENENTAPIATEHSIAYENAVQTSANRTFDYRVIYRKDGSLVLNREELLKKNGFQDADSSEIKLYAISDRGVCYEAVLP